MYERMFAVWQSDQVSERLSTPNPTLLIFLELIFRHNLTISTKFHNFDLTQFRLNLTMVTKFHNFDQISQFRPNFTILTKFHSLVNSLQFGDKIGHFFHNWGLDYWAHTCSTLLNSRSLEFYEIVTKVNCHREYFDALMCSFWNSIWLQTAQSKISPLIK